MGTFTDIVRRSTTPKKDDFQLGIEHVYEWTKVRLKVFLTLTEKGRGF